MKNKSIYIRPFQKGDESSIIQFQELLWAGGIELNLKYFRWKYESNPYLDSQFISLAFNNNTLIGMVSAFGAKWIDRNGIYEFPCISDTLVAPKFRSTGVFSKLLDHLLNRLKSNRIPWLFDFGDQPAGPLLVMKGWKSVGPFGIAFFRKSFDIEKITEFGFLEQEIDNYKICLKLESSPDKVSRILNNFQLKDSIRHVIDSEFLKWRFSNPLAQYYFIEYDDGVDIGMLISHRPIAQKLDAKIPTVITECVASSLKIWELLIEKAIKTLPGSEITIWLKGLSVQKKKILKSFGFNIILPEGSLIKDLMLPNLFLYQIIEGSLNIVKLCNSNYWDLTGVCGRSWR